MAQAGGFKGYMDNFKKSKFAIPFALLLTGLICYFLLIVGSVLFCLLPAVIALIIFLLPRYFGLVDRKKSLIWGTVLILVLGIASGLTYYSILSIEEPVTLSTTDGVLTGGSITPFRGTDATDFHFSVIYTGTDINPHVNLTVYDYYLASQGTTYVLTNDTTYTGVGDRYILNKTFNTSIYDFGFSYDKADGTTVLTDLSWGPYTMTNNDILVNELWKVPLTMFLNVGLLFYLIVLLTWWMDRSKKRFETQGGKYPGKTGAEDHGEVHLLRMRQRGSSQRRQVPAMRREVRRGREVRSGGSSNGRAQEQRVHLLGLRQDCEGVGHPMLELRQEVRELSRLPAAQHFYYRIPAYGTTGCMIYLPSS